jgi:hypothetical protein
MGLTIPTITDGMLATTVEANIDNNFQSLQAEVDTLNTDKSVDALPLNPQATAPAQSTGQVYYSSVDNTIKTQTDLSGVELSSDTMVIRVINNSGSPISKFKPVRHNGVSIKLPQIVLAQADSFINGTVLGVTFHDILNGAEGYIVVSGVIRGVNTLSLTAGVPIYLDSALLGAFVTTTPDILTQVGGVLDSTTSGSFQVSIRNLMNLPTIGAYYQTLADTTTIDTTIRTWGDPTEFPLGFSTSKSLAIDITDGYSFVVPATGVYSLSTVVSMSNIPASNNGYIIKLDIFNVTTSTVMFTYNAIVGRNDTVMSASFPLDVQLTNGDKVNLRFSSADNLGSGIVIDGIQLSIKSEQIR